MLNTIDRHLAREWLKSFALTTGAILGLFYVQNLYDNLGDFLDHGSGAGEILRYYMLVTPAMLSPVLPLSVLVATLLSYGALHRNQEVTAMRAMGRGIWGLLRLNLMFTALLSVGLLLLGQGAISNSVERARTLYDAMVSQSEAGADVRQARIQPLVFRNPAADRLWVMNQYDPESASGRGVYLYFRAEGGSPVRRLTARTVAYDPGSGQWRFREGREVLFDKGGMPTRFTDFKEKILGGMDSPGAILASQKQVDDLSLRELRELAGSTHAGHAGKTRRYGVRYHQAVASPFNCMLALLIGVPFAVAGTRVNPMVGATKAIGIFVSYFLLSSACRMFGEQGLVTPVLAGWLPIGLMGFFALVLLVRAR
jgi:lipopolysaccharide export system permease protein